MLANKPSIFLTVKKNEEEKRIVIGSEIIWDLGYILFDAEQHFKNFDFYFNGNDQETQQLFWIDDNKIEINAYFPLQINGKKLVRTTTVHLSIKVNGKEIFTSKHFGQISEWLVPKLYGVLPRPLMIELTFDSYNKGNITIDGQLEETDYDKGFEIDKHFLIEYKIENIQECIDDQKLALDKELYLLSTRKKNLNIETTTQDDEIKSVNVSVPFTVNETFEIFYTAKQAYQTLDFIAHEHADVYGITTEDWYTYVDLEIETTPFYNVRQKIIAMEIEEFKNEDTSVLRIRDPEFSLFSNTVSFDNGNFSVNRTQYCYHRTQRQYRNFYW